MTGPKNPIPNPLAGGTMVMGSPPSEIANPHAGQAVPVPGQTQPGPQPGQLQSGPPGAGPAPMYKQIEILPTTGAPVPGQAPAAGQGHAPPVASQGFASPADLQRTVPHASPGPAPVPPRYDQAPAEPYGRQPDQGDTEPGTPQGYAQPPHGYAQPGAAQYAAPQGYPGPQAALYGPPPAQGHAAPPVQGYAAPPAQGYAPPPAQGYAAPPMQGYAAPQSPPPTPAQGYGQSGAHGYAQHRYAGTVPAVPYGQAPAQPYAEPPQQPPAPQGYASAAQPGPAATSAAPKKSPAAGCLHAYPVAVRTPGFFAALKLSFKAFPYALFRFLHWCLFSTVSAIMLALILGVGTALTVYVQKWVGVGVLLGGVIAWGFLWLPFMERKTFATQCGHIAILTELITQGRIGNGQKGMFAFGNELVAQRLGALETIYDVYRIINRAVRKLTNVLNFADRLLPVDLGPVKRVVYRIIGWAAPYVTSVVLSYGIARDDEDFGAAGMDGLCYSAQNAKGLLKTAIGVVLLEQLLVLPWWLVSLAAFVPGVFYVVFSAMGGDFAALQANAAEFAKAEPITFLAAAAAGLVVGGLFAYLTVKTVRESFIKPMLVTMVMVKFHVAIENQPLEPGIKDKVLGADSALSGLDKLRYRAGLVT